MHAQDIMTADPVCVTPETLIREAARLMGDRNVGMLPVVDGNGSHTLVGVITDRDIAIRHVAPGHDGDGCLVREAMSTNVATLAPDADVTHIMAMMQREQVRRIPIVNEDTAVVGVVSQADIARAVGDARATSKTFQQISRP